MLDIPISKDVRPLFKLVRDFCIDGDLDFGVESMSSNESIVERTDLE